MKAYGGVTSCPSPSLAFRIFIVATMFAITMNKFASAKSRPGHRLVPLSAFQSSSARVPIPSTKSKDEILWIEDIRIVQVPFWEKRFRTREKVRILRHGPSQALSDNAPVRRSYSLPDVTDDHGICRDAILSIDIVLDGTVRYAYPFVYNLF